VDRQTYFDPAEYATFCDRVDAWAVIEDGSFRSRLSAPAPLANIGVGLAGGIDRPTFEVVGLSAAGSSSRCNEGIAVLLLSRELSGVVLPLRLDDSAEVGEGVLTSGIVPEEGRFMRRDEPGVIQHATAERGDELIPPQSLLLQTNSCYLSRGGPVLAEASGALVALVTWGQNRSCDDATGGSTTAIRLAPYRALLLEAASGYGQTVYSERTNSDIEVPECDVQTAP
jgi:hypothetical protein